MKQSTAAPAAPAASTHQFVADPLAAMAARAVTTLVAGGLVVVGAVLGSVEADALWPLLALALAVFPLVYGAVLLYNLPDERRRFYAQEVKDGVDHNKDGVVGKPQGHVVNVDGKPAFTLPDLHPETPPGPPPALVHFPCTANDVLAVLDGAQRDGLGFRAWEGKRLPSGVKLDRVTWGAVQDGLLAWKFATARQTKTGRVVELRQDIDVETMKDAALKGAG